MNKIKIRNNGEKEVFELIEENGIIDDGEKEDAIIADVYVEAHAELIKDLLNERFGN